MRNFPRSREKIEAIIIANWILNSSLWQQIVFNLNFISNWTLWEKIKDDLQSSFEKLSDSLLRIASIVRYVCKTRETPRSGVIERGDLECQHVPRTTCQPRFTREKRVCRVIHVAFLQLVQVLPLQIPQFFLLLYSIFYNLKYITLQYECVHCSRFIRFISILV